MRHLFLCLAHAIVLSTWVFNASAQEADLDSEDAYNPHSVAPVPEAHKLFSRKVWREIHLKEKQNSPFFAQDKEITKVIIDGVREGVLTPYSEEDFAQEMTTEEFWDRLKLPEEGHSAAGDGAEGFTDDGWGDEGEKGTAASKNVHGADYFLPREITILELIEDRIFDKVRSVLVHDIQAIKLIIPADKFETGLRREVGVFRYKDLAQYFDSLGDKAGWINVNNSARNLKFTDAFTLRLFSSKLVKVENPAGARLEDIYEDPRKASEEWERKLQEEECFLWEP